LAGLFTYKSSSWYQRSSLHVERVNAYANADSLPNTQTGKMLDSYIHIVYQRK